MAKKKTNDDIVEMTQETFEELSAELERRINEDRGAIAKEISDARELGDLSENHAYTVAMEKKDHNENRIKDLEDILLNVKIVKKASSNNVVTIGSKVQLTNKESKKSMTITLVGSEKTEAADPREKKISIDSPIGSAIHNSKVGEEVKVSLPSGEVLFKIDKILK